MADKPALPESSEQFEVFDGIGLAIGSSLTIETVSPVRKYTVHLIGYEVNKSVLVSCPLRGGNEVRLEKDSTLAVRLLVGKKVCAFETKVLYRSMQPYSYYHLAYPAAITSMQVRNSERVEILLHTDVDSDFDIIGDWPKPARINDLSKTGARMISTYNLGEKGHEIFIELDLMTSGLNKSLRLRSIIRNVEHNPEATEGRQYTFGVQFLDLSDEQTLTLSNYIYEHD